MARPEPADRADGDLPETAERILDAATRCFAEQGISGTGMRLLAEEAGVSVPTVYNHFENKEAVVRAVFARNGIVAEVTGGPDQLPDDVAGRVAALLEHHLAFAREHLELSRLIYRESANGSPEAQAMANDMVEHWVASWRSVLAGASDLRPGVDLDQAAEAVKCAAWGALSVDLLREDYDVQASIEAIVVLVAASLSSAPPSAGA